MPSNFGPLQNFTAGSDLSAKQFYIMEGTTAGVVDLANAATDKALGILYTKPKSGAAASVMTRQGARASAACDGTTDIAAYDWLGVNSAGVLVKKATADYTVCALALEVCTLDGVEIHDVLWLGPGFFRAALG